MGGGVWLQRRASQSQAAVQQDSVGGEVTQVAWAAGLRCSGISGSEVQSANQHTPLTLTIVYGSGNRGAHGSVTKVTGMTKNGEGVWFLPGPDSCYRLGMESCLKFLLKQQASEKAAGKVMQIQALPCCPTALGSAGEMISLE